ncbi:hypothetical protein PG996_010517 [Apiospora saccharicola]|uniref:Rhodopsin domain-containing protein n=1 Tax=Apiospora saccharicola TaxID=335842 RepID=A0ABR1UNT9_9PEZI
MADYDWYLDNTPAGKPPQGEESNLVNPESHSYQLVIVIAVMTALTVLFTAGRAYTRLKITKSFGADDCKSSCPMFCIDVPVHFAHIFMSSRSLPCSSLCDIVAGGGVGRHLWDTPLRKYIEFSKTGIANSVLLRIDNTLIKCGFFVFYLRLFGPKDHTRTMVFAGMTVVISFCIAFVIGYLVTALPGNGDFLDKDYRVRIAGVPQKLITAAAYVSVLTDVYIMFIPLHQIPNLGLSYKRKWGISLIFLTGLLATGAGIANIVFRHNASVIDFKDVTWTGQWVLMTSACEVNLGIVCLSMPVVLALFVGRITAFGQSLGSWVNLRKAQRHGAGDSASNLSPSDGNESAPEAPELPSKRIPDPKLGGMRKFIRNLNRSRVDNSTTVMSTFNDLTSADFSYHHQLKTLSPSQTANIRRRNSENFEKLGKLGQ